MQRLYKKVICMANMNKKGSYPCEGCNDGELLVSDLTSKQDDKLTEIVPEIKDMPSGKDITPNKFLDPSCISEEIDGKKIYGICKYNAFKLSDGTVGIVYHQGSPAKVPGYNIATLCEAEVTVEGPSENKVIDYMKKLFTDSGTGIAEGNIKEQYIRVLEEKSE